MFSDAISSISARWRESSRRTTSAISGSLSASDAENIGVALPGLAEGSLGDIMGLLAPLRPQLVGNVWNAQADVHSVRCPNITSAGKRQGLGSRGKNAAISGGTLCVRR